MANAALKSAVDAVLELTDEEQAMAAALLQEFVAAQGSRSLLTPEQVDEVRRRLARQDMPQSGHDDTIKRLVRRYGG